ncbi:hypothetical protein [Pseudomonas sp. MRSN 12121]|uniref:hypothetical protein n=1 Tax=Pseudomonas sp. MRSN 12121 TaxID=1611770 RepID=UPI000A47210A|nr:hypothetical protein [Pseudomonas sp. MRSN 12121]
MNNNKENRLIRSNAHGIDPIPAPERDARPSDLFRLARGSAPVFASDYPYGASRYSRHCAVSPQTA